MGTSTKPGDLSFSQIDDILRRSKKEGTEQSRDRLGSEAATDLSSKPRSETTRQLETARSRGSNEPVTETDPDGTKRSFDWVEKDGQLVARLKSYEKDGVSREFKYDDPADKSKVTEFTERIKTYYGDGKDIVATNKREGNSDTFTYTDNTGRKETRDNVEIKNGQVSYEARATTLLDLAIESVFGKTRLISGDLESAKAHALQVAADHNLFHGNNEKAKRYIDMFINRAHTNAAAHISAPTDDAIASALRSMVRPLEETRSGAAAALSTAKLNSAVESAFRFAGDPWEADKQGSVGSCFLNSRLFHAMIGKNVDKAMNAFANIYTHSSFKGAKFNNYDLTSHYGRDPFNHAMTSFMSKKFGFQHLDPGFRGTTYNEANIASYALEGTKFAAAPLSWAMAHLPQVIRSIEKNSTYSVYTMNMAHSQELALKVNPTTGRRDLVLVNHWFSHDDKVLKRGV